jgi:hypothetical protein
VSSGSAWSRTAATSKPTFETELDRALEAIKRPHTRIRFVVAGFGDQDDEEEEEPKKKV